MWPAGPRAVGPDLSYAFWKLFSFLKVVNKTLKNVTLSLKQSWGWRDNVTKYQTGEGMTRSYQTFEAIFLCLGLLFWKNLNVMSWTGPERGAGGGGKQVPRNVTKWHIREGEGLKLFKNGSRLLFEWPLMIHRFAWRADCDAIVVVVVPTTMKG